MPAIITSTTGTIHQEVSLKKPSPPSPPRPSFRGTVLDNTAEGKEFHISLLPAVTDCQPSHQCNDALSLSCGKDACDCSMKWGTSAWRGRLLRRHEGIVPRCLLWQMALVGNPAPPYRPSSVASGGLFGADTGLRQGRIKLASHQASIASTTTIRPVYQSIAQGWPVVNIVGHEPGSADNAVSISEWDRFEQGTIARLALSNTCIEWCRHLRQGRLG